MEYPKRFATIPEQSDQDRAFNACCTGDRDTLENILYSQPTLQLDAANIITPMSVLPHAAAANGSIECLKMLQRYQANLDIAFEANDPNDKDLRTPLREAVRHGQYAAVKFLCEQGAQVKVCMFSDIYRSGNNLEGHSIEITEFLLHEIITAPNHEEDDLDRWDSNHPCVEVWWHAIWHDRPEIGTRLFPHINEIHPDGLLAGELSNVVESRPRSAVMFDLLLQNTGDNYDEEDHMRALVACAVTCQIPFARKMLAMGDTGCFGSWYEQRCLPQALIHAVESNCSELITILIDRGVSPDAASFQNHTAIYQAVSSAVPTIETLQQLLNNGADPNLQSIGFAERLGDPEYQLSNASTFPSCIAKGNTPLHALAKSNVGCSHILVERAKKLLGAGANVNALNAKGFTPLDILEAYYFGGSQRKPAANSALADTLRSFGGQTRAVIDMKLGDNVITGDTRSSNLDHRPARCLASQDRE